MQNMEEKQEITIAKVIGIIAGVLCVLFLILILIIAINLNHKKIFNFLGYKLTIENQASTNNLFEAGDLIILKQAEEKELRGGDIITYWNTDKSALRTHKVENIIIGKDGRKQYIINSNEEESKESEIVNYNQIEGKYVGHIKYLGNIITSLQNPIIIIVILIIPVIVYILICRHKIKREEIKLERKEKLLKRIAEKNS